jgi:hypothetical protein
VVVPGLCEALSAPTVQIRRETQGQVSWAVPETVLGKPAGPPVAFDAAEAVTVTVPEAPATH